MANIKIELPELPTDIDRWWRDEEYRADTSEEAMRSYGIACMNAALEAAAKACEQKRGETNLGVDAWITCDAIARQLRALKEPT